MKLKLILLLAPVALWSCSGSSSKPKIVTAAVKQKDTTVADFNAFFKRFNSDPVFQKQHVKFPLKMELQAEHGDSIGYLAAKDWVNIKMISKGKDIYTKEQHGKTEVNIIYQLEDTGMHFNYYFRYKAGEWRLENLKDDGD